MNRTKESKMGMITQYWHRNERWLLSFLSTVGALITLAIYQPLNVDLQLGMPAPPAWFGIVIGCVGFCWSGVTSTFVDTLSAQLIRAVTTATVLLFLLIRFFG